MAGAHTWLAGLWRLLPSLAPQSWAAVPLQPALLRTQRTISTLFSVSVHPSPRGRHRLPPVLVLLSSNFLVLWVLTAGSWDGSEQNTQKQENTLRSRTDRLLRTSGTTVLAKAMTPLTSHSWNKQRHADIILLCFSFLLFCFNTPETPSTLLLEISNIKLLASARSTCWHCLEGNVCTRRTLGNNYRIRIISTDEISSFS